MIDQQELSPSGPDLTVSEVATTLRISVTTARRYLKKGAIPNVIRLPGGQYRIPQQSLIEFKHEHTQQGAS